MSRWFGAAGIALAVIGAAVAIWLGFFAVPDTVDQTLEPAIEGLDFGAGLAGDLETRFEETAADLAAGRDDRRQALSELVADLTSTTTRLGGALETIDAIPGLGVVVPDELPGRIAALDARLDEISSALAADDPDFTPLADLLGLGADELEEASEWLADESDDLDRFRSAVRLWSIIATIGVLLLAFWMGAGQLALMQRTTGDEDSGG